MSVPSLLSHYIRIQEIRAVTLCLLLPVGWGATLKGGLHAGGGLGQRVLGLNHGLATV